MTQLGVSTFTTKVDVSHFLPQNLATLQSFHDMNFWVLIHCLETGLLRCVPYTRLNMNLRLYWQATSTTRESFQGLLAAVDFWFKSWKYTVMVKYKLKYTSKSNLEEPMILTVRICRTLSFPKFGGTEGVYSYFCFSVAFCTITWGGWKRFCLSKLLRMVWHIQWLISSFCSHVK